MNSDAKKDPVLQELETNKFEYELLKIQCQNIIASIQSLNQQTLAVQTELRSIQMEVLRLLGRITVQNPSAVRPACSGSDVTSAGSEAQ